MDKDECLVLAALVGMTFVDGEYVSGFDGDPDALLRFTKLVELATTEKIASYFDHRDPFRLHNGNHIARMVRELILEKNFEISKPAE